MAGTNIGTAYVQIVPSAEGLGAKLNSSLNSEVPAAGKAAGLGIGKALIGTMAALGIGKAIKASIMEGAALEQSLGGVETLYKNHADTVIANANKAWQTAGVSANQYMEQSTTFAAALLNSLGGDTAAAAKYADMAIVDMSDNANKFGSDLTSLQSAYQGFSKQNYTMLDNLKLGYGGTKSEMERLLVDAGKLSGQKYDISSLSDVYEAIHVVQEELGVTGTTAKEAASTLSGSFNAMKSAGTNLMGALVTGTDVAGPMTALAQSAATFFVGNLAPAIGRLGAGAADAVYRLGKMMSDPAAQKKMINSASKLITGLVIGLGENLPKVAAGALMIAGSLVKTLSGALVKSLKQLGAKAVSTLFKALDIRAKLAEWRRKLLSFFPINLGRILNIKLPHLKITGGKAPWGLGGAGVAPNIGVEWHAEGGIFTRPTVIGNQGFGEAGAEAILPLERLWQEMDRRFGNIGGGTLNVIMQLDGQTIGQTSVDYINAQTIMMGASPVMI